MGGDLLRRGAAIGVALGLVAAAETVRSTPALRADLASALELSAVFVWIYGALGLAFGGLLVAAARAGAAGLGRARTLWPLALLAVAFAVWNENARSIEALDHWRHVGRAGIALAAFVLLVRGVASVRRTGQGTRRAEALLAGVLAPAALGVAAYVLRPAPVPTGDTTPEAVLALAPRFAPEPAGTFARVGDAGRPRVLVIGVDGASWDRVERGIANGTLPTFAKLRERGVSASLRSEVPTYSPRIWTTIATGVGAADHGVESFYLYQLPRLGIESVQLRRSLGVARAVLERTGE